MSANIEMPGKLIEFAGSPKNIQEATTSIVKLRLDREAKEDFDGPFKAPRFARQDKRPEIGCYGKSDSVI